jgi:hypothetical protein
MGSARRGADHGTPAWFDWGVRIVAALVVLALAALLATEAVDAGRAAAVAGLVVVCLVILAVPLSRLAQVESISVYGVELKIAQASIVTAPTARLTAEGEGDEDREGDEGQNTGEIIDLQFLLEAKLAYVAKHILGFEGSGHWAPFLTLGSLKYDGYLSREDAVAARELLALSPATVRGAAEEERRAFLDKAKPFVRNIRATIFHDVVRSVLKKDFKLEPRAVDRGGGRRPDFLVPSDRFGHVFVFPAFAGGGAYWGRERIRRRAAELAGLSDHALVVVPPNVRTFDTKAEGVTMAGLDDLVHLAAAGGSLDSLLDDSVKRARSKHG